MKSPSYNGAALQDPHTSSVVIVGVYVSRHDHTLSIFFFSCIDFWNYYNAIYLTEIEKHGCSQFVHDFKPSNRKYCIIT